MRVVVSSSSRDTFAIADDAVLLFSFYLFSPVFPFFGRSYSRSRTIPRMNEFNAGHKRNVADLRLNGEMPLTVSVACICWHVFCFSSSGFFYSNLVPSHVCRRARNR